MTRPWSNTTPQPHRLTGRALQQRNAEVMEQYAGRCWMCGLPGADQVDHVVNLAEGGPEETHPPYINCRPIHSNPCHKKKTSREARRGRQRARTRLRRTLQPLRQTSPGTPLPPVGGRNEMGGVAHPGYVEGLNP